MDSLTKERRSWNMSRIRAKDTKPELAVRSLLHRMGYRFRLNNTVLPGRPDIVLPRHRAVVFVHGCFWHRHAGCRYAYTPKSRIDFWQRKFDSNIRRDQQVAEQLKELQWSQLVMWECEIKNPEAQKRLIKAFFRDR
ncbi:very short patch repair endonuclease [Lacunimicrobium album]